MISANNTEPDSGVVDFVSEVASHGIAKRSLHDVEPIRIDDWVAVGNSTVWLATQNSAIQYAMSREPVAFVGEYGTGKTQLAKQLHLHTDSNYLIKVHCGRLAALFESTGPDTLHNWWLAFQNTEFGEQANWLFQYIDELPLSHQTWIVDQVKLLRRRQPQTAILSTSRRTFQELLDSGRLRQDLYYTLGVLEIVVPSLRQRATDIVPLAEHFGRRNTTARIPLRFSREAVSLLESHNWPGNVVELRNQIARLQVHSERNLVDSDDLASLRTVAYQAESDLANLSLEDAETRLILKALSRNAGNKTATAKHLGITTRTLHNKMRKYKSMGLLANCVD